MNKKSYFISLIILLTLLYALTNHLGRQSEAVLKNEKVNSLIPLNKKAVQKSSFQRIPDRTIASKRIHSSSIDNFTKEEIGIPHYQLVIGVSISHKEIPSKILLMKSGNMFFYQEEDNLFHNAIYDKRKKAFALWTKIISLKAKEKALKVVLDNYSVKITGSNMPFAINIQVNNDFDILNDLSEIVKTDGVYEVKLDLIYSRQSKL